VSSDTRTLSAITADGLQLAIDLCGEGTPVLLIHGLGFTRKRWSAQVECLVAAGCRVATFDLRGFGDSELPHDDYTIATLAEDVERVRLAVDFDTFHLVGHSLGGMVALQYAMENQARVRSICLASTSCHNGRRASALGHLLARISAVGFDAAMEDGQVQAALEALAGSVAQYVPTILEPLRKVTKEPDPARALAWRATAGFSVRWRLHELTCPGVVMHGANDMLMPFAAGIRLGEGLPNGRWLPVPGAGHNLPVRRPEIFNAALLALIDSVRAPEGPISD
jgi:pimeloyl-ACP methyl ester carboxylesterase